MAAHHVCLYFEYNTREFVYTETSYSHIDTYVRQKNHVCYLVMNEWRYDASQFNYSRRWLQKEPRGYQKYVAGQNCLSFR